MDDPKRNIDELEKCRKIICKLDVTVGVVNMSIYSFSVGGSNKLPCIPILGIALYFPIR